MHVVEKFKNRLGVLELCINDNKYYVKAHSDFAAIVHFSEHDSYTKAVESYQFLKNWLIENEEHIGGTRDENNPSKR